MTCAITTLSENASIAEALTAMQNGPFRHLPLLDERGQPLAIVSISHILAHLVNNFPEEFVNLPPTPAAEASHKWGA